MASITQERKKWRDLGVFLKSFFVYKIKDKIYTSLTLCFYVHLTLNLLTNNTDLYYTLSIFEIGEVR